MVAAHRWEGEVATHRINPNSWKGTDDAVFTTAWGGAIYPTTVTGLPRKLVEAHNKTATDPPARPTACSRNPAAPGRRPHQARPPATADLPDPVAARP